MKQLLAFLLIISIIYCGEADDSSGQNYKWQCDCNYVSTSEQYCQEWTCEIERISAKCFPGTSLILLPNFETKKIDELEIGDKILTMDKQTNQFFEDEVIEFLHYLPPKIINQNQSSESYLKITTDQQNILKVSKDHLIFTQDPTTQTFITKLAKDLQLNDIIYGLGNGNQNYGCSQIIQSIEQFNENIIELGEYAPLTSSGTLIVDGVLVSSYANLNNQQVADIVFSPYILMQQWIPQGWRNSLRCYTDEGINCYANFLMKISENLPFYNYKE